jgi:hypothetical protein
MSTIKGNTDGTITISGPISFSASTSSMTIANPYQYSDPVEMDKWYTDTGLVIVYKQVRTPMFTNTFGNVTPQSETLVYAESHTFGAEGHKVERTEGKYIHPREESYAFGED